MSEKLRLAFHGSWKGLDGLGLDDCTRTGIAYQGLDQGTWFANLGMAYRHALSGGCVIYGVNPDEVPLVDGATGQHRKPDRDFEIGVSKYAIPPDAIRLVLLPGNAQTLARTLDIGKEVREYMPNAQVVIFDPNSGRSRIVNRRTDMTESNLPFRRGLWNPYG